MGKVFSRLCFSSSSSSSSSSVTPSSASAESSNNRRASFFDNDVIRRLSIVAGDVILPEDPELRTPAEDPTSSPNQKPSSPPPAPTTPIDTSEKITLTYHAVKTNLLAVIISAPALFLVYVIYEHISKRFPEIGGMWGDHHAVLCAICIGAVEIILMLVWKFERGYMLRRLVHWPATWVVFMLTSKLAFEDRPGHFTGALMTVAWGLGNVATYPLYPSPRPTFLMYVKRSAINSIIIHGSFIAIIYGQIISTKLLSHSNSILTSLVTGIAFPFMTWVARKLTIRQSQKLVTNKRGGKGLNPREQLAIFDRMVKVLSGALVLTPCALNYLNTSVKLAVLSATLQMATEVLGKIWIAHLTRKTFEDYIAALEGERGDVYTALTLAAQEPGLNGLNMGLNDETTKQMKSYFNGEIDRLKTENGQQKENIDALSSQIKELGGVPRLKYTPVATTGDTIMTIDGAQSQGIIKDKDADAATRDQKKKDLDAKLERAMLMLAARWNAEIVAEKVGIIVASLIAISLFDRGDGVSLTTEQLILVAAILFAMEVITDVTFVVSMDRFLRVPILAKAINESGLFTMNVLQDSIVTCLIFVATSSCIKMADMIVL